MSDTRLPLNDETAAMVGPRLFTLAEQRDMATRVTLLEDAIAHVLRYGKVGKQSKDRLRAALAATQLGRAR